MSHGEVLASRIIRGAIPVIPLYIFIKIRVRFGVNTYILNQPEEIEAQALNILQYDQDGRRGQPWKIQEYKNRNERWFCVYWYVAEPTFEAIESLILEKASLLDRIEMTLR